MSSKHHDTTITSHTSVVTTTTTFDNNKATIDAISQQPQPQPQLLPQLQPQRNQTGAALSTPPRNMSDIPSSSLSSLRSSTPITSNLNHRHRTNNSTVNNSRSNSMVAPTASPSSMITTRTATVSTKVSSSLTQHNTVIGSNGVQHNTTMSSSMNNNAITTMPTATTNKRLYRTAVISETTKPSTSAATTNGSEIAAVAATTGVSVSTTNTAMPPTTFSTATNTTTITPTATPTTTTTTTKWVTRDIASLEFLLNIPLVAEREIVTTGYQLQIQRELDYYHSHHPSSASSSQFSGDEESTTTGAAAAGGGDPVAAMDHNNTTNRKVSFQAYTSSVTIPSSAKGTWWEKWIATTSTDPLHINNNNKSNNELSSGLLITTKTNTINNTMGDAAELEQPTEADRTQVASNNKSAKLSMQPSTSTATTSNTKVTPGRRLDGDLAIRIQIPVTTKTTTAAATTAGKATATTTTLLTKQTSIARQAALREWEIQTAFGSRCHTSSTTITSSFQPQQQQQSALVPPLPPPVSMGQPPMLDGRLFFSANSSYPISVFSIIRYEPRKEEAAFRRRKLEAIGGGGSQFVLPNRDWRGISYRALLRRSGDDKKETKKFNRFMRINTTGDNEKDKDNSGKSGKDDDSSTTSDSSSSSDDSYAPGLLDDPGMVLGRHRNVMIGDRVTGPIVSSTIQFVKPAVLKAELNKQFRERFDGWEPPKSARKYIGAKVIQGNYVLIDPTEEFDEQSYERRRPRQNSVTSMSTSSDGGPKEYTIRMPPSLTLSKIRSAKRQALNAAVKANLEIGTVAMACVYFERLCLDCRVDKSNRRVTLAACLLLAAKLNEPNVGLVMEREKKHGGTKRASSSSSSKEDKQTRFQSTIRPNERSNNMFASLLLFFTQDWNLSLKYLFTVEWGVFAALNFSLDASPSQIAFHFKRLMKTLEWNVLNYLGSTMYNQWQDALADEDERRMKRERRREVSRKNNEDRIRGFRFKFRNEQNHDTVDTDSDNEHHIGTNNNTEDNKVSKTSRHVPLVESSKEIPPKSPTKPKSTTQSIVDHTNRRIKLFNRFNLGRSASTEQLEGTNVTTVRSGVRSSIATIVPSATIKETAVIPLHTSPSMPNFLRSTSSLISKEDAAVQKANSDNNDDGMVAIDIPVPYLCVIETDDTTTTTTVARNVGLDDDIENGRLRPSKQSSNIGNADDDDEGIVV